MKRGDMEATASVMLEGMFGHPNWPMTGEIARISKSGFKRHNREKSRELCIAIEDMWNKIHRKKLQIK